MTEETATWIVGPEHDRSCFDRLGSALRDHGYALTQDTWGVAGSQEVREWRLEGPGGSLLVVSETYVGLSVTGVAKTIDRLRNNFNRDGVSPE